MGWFDTLRKSIPGNTKPGTGPIGIDFSKDAIHALQIESNVHRPILGAVASIGYPTNRETTLANPKELVSTLKSLLKSAQFKGRSVVAALPPTETKVIPIEYPVTKTGQDAGQILELLKDRLPDPLDNYVIDYVPVRLESRNGQNLALVAASQKTTVLRLLESLGAAGLDPLALEIGPIAIRRFVSILSTSDVSQNILVVNIGEQKTYLTLISGRRLLMDQEVNIGQSQLLETVAENLELSPAEALSTIQFCGLNAGQDGDSELRDQIQTLGLILRPEFRLISSEIDRAFRYASSMGGGNSDRRVFLSGSVARWPGAAPFLAELTKTEVEFFPSPVDFKNGEQIKSSYSGEFAIATGLALRGMNDHV